MRWVKPVVVAFLALVAAQPAGAEERLAVEETFLSVDIGGRPYRLEALIAKEAGAGKLPVALITHGQPREAERRERATARGYLRVAREFARRGWLAVVVIRRGYGRSGGDHPHALRGCRDGDFGPAIDEQTDDIEAALGAIGKRADADIGEVIALGVSFGGAVALNLAARNPPGLRAAVNVSGGIRPVTPEGRQPRCTPEQLVPIFAKMGGRVRVASLWLYAENDSLFPPDYVRQLHEAYVAAGGRTTFHMFEPIGADGHDMFGRPEGMLRWIPALDQFLRTNRLRTYDPAPLEAAVRELNAGGPARAFMQRYHGRATEKALAISRSHRTMHITYGTAEVEDAEKKAVEGCAERAKEPCRLLLRNFEVVREP